MEIGQFLVFFMKVLISSTASGPGNHVFIQTGGSVELDIKNKTLPEFNSLVWVKDMSDNIVKFISQSGYIRQHSLYKNRVEFNTETFSVTLRNMKKTDSGIYMAKTKGDQEICVAKHNISVIDPVDFPVLKENFTMISVNVCIVNVSCSGRDHTVSNRYYSNNCTQEEMTSFGIQTLALYCIENIVVCNYSNPVSWKNDTVEIHQLCTSHEPENLKEIISSFPLHWLLVITGVSVLVFTAVSVICCSYKKRKKSAQQIDQTVYAQVQLRNDMQRPLEMLEKSANPQTVYGFTGESKQTHNMSQTMPTPQIRKQVQKENHPSTTYSTIGQTPKPSFASETDHTIYSEVCKSTRARQPVHK